MKSIQDIYQKYMNNEIDETNLILMVDEYQTKSVKDDGVIYTPFEIVEKMIELAKPKITDQIVEPSCGHGAFIFGLLTYIRKNNNINGDFLLNWFIHNVTAIDISKKAIEDLKTMIVFYFKKHFNIEIKEELLVNIKCKDGLKQTRDTYDLCIGNPPYIRTKNIDEDYLLFLRKNFKSCEKGNIDIYYAFIENYIRISKKVCFITPSSFLSNASAKMLRTLMNKTTTHLVDFKDKIIFKDARTYTAIFLMDNDSNSDYIKHTTDIDKNFETVEKIKVFKTEYKRKEKESVVYSSIATLADSTYLVKKVDDKFFKYHDNVMYEIESDILLPYLKLTKQKDVDLSNIDYMIYPYDKNKDIIPECVMMETYPLTYKYLLSVKSKLIQRDRGKTDKYPEWYAYGRKQGIYNFTTGNVISIPLMIGGECFPIELDLNELIQKYNRVLFTSGFIVPKIEENKALYDFVLTDEFIKYSKSAGKAWPGKKEPYYALTVKLIKSINFEIV